VKNSSTITRGEVGLFLESVSNVTELTLSRSTFDGLIWPMQVELINPTSHGFQSPFRKTMSHDLGAAFSNSSCSLILQTTSLNAIECERNIVFSIAAESISSCDDVRANFDHHNCNEQLNSSVCSKHSCR
jgi:hypothetical protein